MNKYALTAIAGAAAGMALMGCLAFADGNEIDPVKTAGVVEVREELPPCPTEDSEGCYWDAETMGNKQGTDVVTLPPAEYPTEGMPEDFDPETDSTAPIEMPYEGQWDEVPEGTLICGEGAMPAIDYNEVWGWWAYCEPALVD